MQGKMQSFSSPSPKHSIRSSPGPGRSVEAPRIVQLQGLANFDEWESALRVALAYIGLDGFLNDGAESRPPRSDSLACVKWAKRRRKAKDLILYSIEPIMGELRTFSGGISSGSPVREIEGVESMGTRGSVGGAGEIHGVDGPQGPESIMAVNTASPNILELLEQRRQSRHRHSYDQDTHHQSVWKEHDKKPHKHFEAAVACMVSAAERSGLVAQLVQALCRVDRQAYDSLAAYQRQLTDLRRRLMRLRNDPGERMFLWVAINGLRSSNSRWSRQLLNAMAAGQLDWQGLMASMSAKACREHLGVPDGADGGECV